MFRKSGVKKNRGFTLIELTVVMCILALLAIAGLTSYAATQRNARDAKRKSDLEAVSLALEAYRVDHGKYPSVGGGWPNLSTYLSPYLSTIPQDPKSGQQYRWNGNNCYDSGGGVFVCQDFELCAALETAPSGGSSCANPGTDYCAGAGGPQCNYGVKSQ